MTHNADFSDIRLFPPGTHCGIIRLRIKDQTAESLHPLLKHAFNQLDHVDVSGKLVTVLKNSIRIRGL